MITKLKNSDFFPYDSYRNEQRQIINQIEDSIRKKKVVLLNAPNGTGKTIIALSAILPIIYHHKLKLIYICRTHAQSTRVIRELQAIDNSTSYTISGLSIRGRNEMCLHNTLLRLKVNPSEAMSVCRDLRKNGNCKYYKNLRTILHGFKDLDLCQFEKPVDAQHLIKFCKERQYCPYFLSKYLLKKMQVVICNYQWVCNPDIKYRFFTLLDTELSKCILVIDECHNIIDVATQVNSDKLTPYLVDACIKDFIKYGFPEKYVQFGRLLLNTLNQKKKDLPLGEQEINPHDFLTRICRRLKLSSIDEFKRFIVNLREIFRENLQFQDRDNEVDLSKNRIIAFIKFWQHWIRKFTSEKYFFCYNLKKVNNRKYISLEIVALDPREITVPLFKKSYACLNLSGTVNGTVYNHLTGMHYKPTGYHEIVAQSPFPRKNIRALITEGVDTRKENRTFEMFQKIIEKINEVVRSTPANIGIFCASYPILNDLTKYGIIPVINKSGKELFIEKSGLSASKNASMLKKFKSLSQKTEQGAVLLGVCGGRNSEGEDFPGDFMNAVIIVGVPYHLPTPRVQAKIQYYNKVFHNQGWVFGYLYPAMQRANQASGRPIRKESDKGAIIFMDSRFQDKKGWISEWVQKEIKIVPDKKNVIYNTLSQFWYNL